MLICVNQNEDLGVPYLDLEAELVRHSASSGRMVQWLPFLRQPRKVGMGLALRCLVCPDFGLPAHSETRTLFLILSLGCRMTRSLSERPESTSAVRPFRCPMVTTVVLARPSFTAHWSLWRNSDVCGLIPT